MLTEPPIDGDLIDKMGQEPGHAFVIRLVQASLTRLFGAERIQVQLRYPRADELLLLIEVADTTVRYDLTAKRDLYCRAGVQEYWVLDLRRRALVVHRDPGEGGYADVRLLPEAELVPIAPGEATVTVAQMLPDPDLP